jgi:histidine triad (HIT) family protein
MTDCLFCQMASGLIRPTVVLETEAVLAFRDIHPQAPVHILVIPKRHVTTFDRLPVEAPELAGALFAAVREVVCLEGLEDSGYRVVANAKEDGGQTVHHLHLHVLGGRVLRWPPG